MYMHVHGSAGGGDFEEDVTLQSLTQIETALSLQHG